MRASRPADSPEQGEHFQLILPTDVTRVGDAVERVALCCFAEADPSSRTRFRLCTVVAEALANAMVYGNHNDPARTVVVDLLVYRERIVISVADEGEGFDPVAVPHPRQTSLESTTGRGLFMIQEFADQVEFNARGNVITVTLPRQ